MILTIILNLFIFNTEYREAQTSALDPKSQENIGFYEIVLPSGNVCTDAKAVRAAKENA